MLISKLSRNAAVTPLRSSVLCVGDFRVDPSLDEISRDGASVKLEPRAMRVLVCLAEHAGEVVSVEQLLDAVWKDVLVTHDSVYQAMAGLRRALGDDPKNPIYIANVQRRGYRLIAPVVLAEHRQIAAPPHRESEPDVAPGSAQRPQVIETAPAKSGAAVQPVIGSRPAIIATIVAVLVLMAGMSLYVYLSRGGERVAGTPAAIHSLVVLPLENLSGDKEQEYFADGMTDALTTNLAEIGSLRVISRTSAMRFKGSKKTLPQIGRDLQVDAVVEGTVARAENRVRITAQLVQASTDHHLWAKTYERDLKDALALQDEIAQDITERIRVKLTPKERSLLMQVHAVDPEAYDATLRGWYWLNQLTPGRSSKALDYFQKAIVKDPNYALAYAGVAASLINLNWIRDPKIREAAMKALALDPSLAEAHMSLAQVKFFNDWDWPGAEAEFSQATALNPSDAYAHYLYSNYLVAMGRLDEAMKEIEHARDLDPFSAPGTWWLGQVLYHARRYDDALRENRRGLEMRPDSARYNAMLYAAMADVYEQKKMFAEAFAARHQALSLNKDPNVTELGEAYKHSGYRGYLLKQAQFLDQAPILDDSHNPPYAAHLYALLDDEARAMTALEAGYSEREPGILFMRSAPELDSIRSSPRFRDLVRRIGFPPSPIEKN
jgi:TolB-like protein/DNA-binding winged helix-turn-helix (wHTH) protein/Tfp pilus assembly protein PilF